MNRTSSFNYISQRSEESRNIKPESKEGSISTTIRRKTKETEINLEYENVAPQAPGNIAVILNIQVKGDFSHHVIEDAMIALNELAVLKGVGHKLI